MYADSFYDEDNDIQSLDRPQEERGTIHEEIVSNPNHKAVYEDPVYPKNHPNYYRNNIRESDMIHDEDYSDSIHLTHNDQRQYAFTPIEEEEIRPMVPTQKLDKRLNDPLFIPMRFRMRRMGNIKMKMKNNNNRPYFVGEKYNQGRACKFSICLALKCWDVISKRDPSL